MTAPTEDQTDVPPASERRLIVKDPKDVVVPVMGTGALVLGVALIYKLISTLSGKTGAAEQTGGDSGNTKNTKTSVPLPPPGEDPYLMYEQSAGQGEVIWQRRDNVDVPRPVEGRAPVQRPPSAAEDPWRTPMNGTSGTNGSSRAGAAPSTPTDLVTERPVIPATPKDVLDNAEGLVQKVRRRS